ncbi:DUF1868 domain-containing protein [Streptomyces sp. NPDC127097]|uniref:DUF1868 domain-containing protein n=1 Tax=Streptomyces sp. NPDC127097 TaxID=3347136 RepID=UPI003669982D
MKWDLDGNAQRFRGNTFVCPVPQDSAFFKAEQQAMALMKDSDLAQQYVCLPHNSLPGGLGDRAGIGQREHLGGGEGVVPGRPSSGPQP